MPMNCGKLLKSWLAHCAAVLVLIAAVEPALAEIDPLQPRMECDGPPPIGMKRFSFATHTEILGGTVTGIEKYDRWKDAVLRQRFANIKGTSCRIVFFTWFFAENEPRLRATGKFQDLFSSEFGKQRHMLRTIAVVDELLNGLDRNLAACLKRLEQERAEVLRDDRYLTPTGGLVLRRINTEQAACYDDAILKLDTSGFVGLWASADGSWGNAFTVVDGKLALWKE